MLNACRAGKQCADQTRIKACFQSSCFLSRWVARGELGAAGCRVDEAGNAEAGARRQAPALPVSTIFRNTTRMSLGI